jgi:tetratricopeptide (TPR) repeat protein
MPSILPGAHYRSIRTSQALGIVALQQGSVVDAHAALESALALDSQHIYASYWLSSLLREQGRHDESDEILLTALNADPLHPLLNTEYANRQWSRGEYERAITHFEKVLEGPDPAADVLFNLSELHREYGDFEQSLYWAKETAKTNPRFAGLLALITACALLDMPERAEFWYERLLEAENAGPPRLGIHSQYFFLTGDIEAAYQLKTRYVDRAGVPLERLPFAVRETFGGIAILSGRLDEGIAVMEELFGREFRIPEHLGGSHFALTFAQILAYAYVEAGRPQDARRICDEIDVYIRSLRAAGNGYSPSFYVVQARNFVLMDRPEQAVSALRRAVQLGWRNIVFERQVPILSALQANTEYRALLSQVSAEVEQQRMIVETSGLDVAGDDLVIALLAQ